MGINKHRKRRHRRSFRQGVKAKPAHRLIGGRTGSKRHKQRSGLLHELKRRG